MNTIAQSLERTRSYLVERNDPTPDLDPPATAQLVSGLQCTIVDEGHGSITTDMPKRIGGSAAGPTPGHYLRGAVATCMATAIAMCAADHDVAIADLAVTVQSRSDNMAFFGLTDGNVEYAGMAIAIEVSAPHASTAELAKIIDYATAHAPVGSSIQHPVPTTFTWTRSAER